MEPQPDYWALVLCGVAVLAGGEAIWRQDRFRNWMAGVTDRTFLYRSVMAAWVMRTVGAFLLIRGLERLSGVTVLPSLGGWWVLPLGAVPLLLILSRDWFGAPRWAWPGWYERWIEAGEGTPYEPTPLAVGRRGKRRRRRGG